MIISQKTIRGKTFTQKLLQHCQLRAYLICQCVEVNNVAHHPNGFVEWAELIISILNNTCQKYLKINGEKLAEHVLK